MSLQHSHQCTWRKFDIRGAAHRFAHRNGKAAKPLARGTNGSRQTDGNGECGEPRQEAGGRCQTAKELEAKIAMYNVAGIGFKTLRVIFEGNIG